MQVRHGAETKGIFLIVFICMLAGIAVFLLILDHIMWKNVSQDAMKSFQRIVGGLGMGAIASPAWNSINFDPRILGVDDSTIWPIAAGYPYGPDRTGTVTYFQEIPKNQIVIREDFH